MTVAEGGKTARKSTRRKLLGGEKKTRERQTKTTDRVLLISFSITRMLNYNVGDRPPGDLSLM